MFPSPRAEARARRGSEARRQHRPVFVDDSGRRRRAARIVGTTVGVLALVYVAFVGLTFAGVAGLDRRNPAGLGALTNPAGDHADVGSDPVEQAAPDLATPMDGTEAGEASADQSATGATTTTVPAATTTTGVPATTTTTVHGRGPATTDHTPNSTVPDRGGPPTSLPG